MQEVHIVLLLLAYEEVASLYDDESPVGKEYTLLRISTILSYFL